MISETLVLNHTETTIAQQALIVNCGKTVIIQTLIEEHDEHMITQTLMAKLITTTPCSTRTMMAGSIYEFGGWQQREQTPHLT